MPNTGSWNGKWSGAEKKYYIIKTFTNGVFKNTVDKLLDGKTSNRFYYNFGDGWGANVEMQIIDAKEATKRRKLSNGFCGYDWMIDSILIKGKITDE